MAVTSIQDRTSEFKAVLAQAQKRQASGKVGAQRRSLLTDSQKAAANGTATPRRSEFARRAAEIGRGIAATMGKLEKLAQCRFYRNLKHVMTYNWGVCSFEILTKPQWLSEGPCSTTGPSK